VYCIQYRKGIIMIESACGDSGVSVLGRLVQATNAHDIDAIVACFGSGYRNDTPAHPSRSFVGREQVRRNWEQILGFVPDIHAEVLRSSAQDAVVWSEWEQRGTRRDGTPHPMRGVIIFGVEDDAIAWARFYLEPVQQAGGNVDDAVRAQVARAAAPGAPPPERR
jgi:ketosteroid isomerase-like protein